MRTALALIAGGVALEALGLDLHPGFRLASSVLLIVTGLAVSILAWTEWGRTERALRAASPLPGSTLSIVVSVAVLLVSALILLGILVR